MTFDTTIPDMLRYNSEMRKSLVDKIFFVDKVDADVIVDTAVPTAPRSRFSA